MRVVGIVVVLVACKGDGGGSGGGAPARPASTREAYAMGMEKVCAVGFQNLRARLRSPDIAANQTQTKLREATDDQLAEICASMSKRPEPLLLCLAIANDPLVCEERTWPAIEALERVDEELRTAKDPAVRCLKARIRLEAMIGDAGPVEEMVEACAERPETVACIVDAPTEEAFYACFSG